MQFSGFLAAFVKSRLNFKDFETKMTLIVFVFLKFWTPRTLLDKCVKSPLLENPSTSNTAERPENLWNLHQSTFFIFIDHCQFNWVGKSLPYWRKKSWYCLLTHWLAMESIVFLIETIQRYQFWCKYLRNKKIFSECLTAFLKSRFNFKHSEKKMNLIPFVFRKVLTPKTLLDKCRKGPVSEDPSTSKLADAPKDCWHLYHSILSYSYITANSIELEKFSLIDMQNLGTAC